MRSEKEDRYEQKDARKYEERDERKLIRVGVDISMSRKGEC